jgi:hypothetical protein
LRDLEVRRFGTAIESSERFGGDRAPARTRIQVCTATGAQTSTFFPAEREGRDSQRELLAHRLAHFERRGTGIQRVDAGVIGRVRIGAEKDVGVHCDVLLHRLEATATLAANPGRDGAAPEVLALVGGLNPTADAHRCYELERQPFQQWIIGGHFCVGDDRSSPNVPQVYLKHSH